MSIALRLHNQKFVGFGWKHPFVSSLLGTRITRVVGDTICRVAVCLLFLFVNSNVWAQDDTQNARIHFDIPEQRADQALTEFAEQADLTLMIPHDLVRDKVANDLIGEYTLEEGAEILLAGTGLTPEFSKNVVMSISIDEPKTEDERSKEKGEDMNVSKKTGFAAVLAAIFSVGANAQDAPDADEGEGAFDEIVVTGTHIPRTELESAMPVSVIRPDDVKNFGRNTIYDALQLDPAIGPGIGDLNSSGQVLDQGVANINLRNLGTNRSLVLVDRRRWVSSGARTSAVDLNTIPTALIDRFETVTGGAAAIYGADAVSGAVNIIMKKEIDGIEFSATTGASAQGDAEQTSVALATGFSFGDDRGKFVIGGEYIDTSPLDALARYDGLSLYFANPDSTGPNDGVPDLMLVEDARQIHRSSSPAFCLPVGPGCQQWYQLINGQVTPISASTYDVIVGGPTGTQNGGPDNSARSFENVWVRPKSERGSIYSNVSYDLTPDVNWNATLSYAFSDTQATPVWPTIRSDSRPFWWGGAGGEVARLTNPFLPDSMRDFMNANGVTEIPLGRTYLNLPRAFEFHERENLTVGSDISGKLTERLDWSAFIRYGEVNNDITTTNMIGKDTWVAARDAVVDPVTGEIVCANPAARAAGCRPVDIFTSEPFRPDVIDYIADERYEETKNSLLTFGAGVHGSFYSLPAGDIEFAVGVEQRREELETRDDPDTAKLANIVYSGGLDYSLHPNLSAERDTTEVFGEIVVPIMRDRAFARRLDFEAAYRYSNYSDNEDTDTWKVGATWEPTDGITLRGVRSHSVRVPNFGELFSPVSQVTFGHINDPCQEGFIDLNQNRAANCAAILPGITLPLPRPNSNTPTILSGGNPNLTPEESDSFTIGAVFQPSFLDGFDMTVDYWNIEIDNVITSLPYLTILNFCVDSPGGPDQTYCQFVTRNAVGEVDSVQGQFANLAERSASGIDIGVNYNTSIGNGELSAHLSSTYLLEQEIVSAVGQPGVDFEGQWNFPTHRATLLTDYSIGKISVGLNTRFVSESDYDVTAPSSETYEISKIDSVIFNDVTVTYRPTETSHLSLGVRNITDEEVPLVLRQGYVSPGASSFRLDGAVNYDVIGRYVFLKIGAGF